MVITSSTPMSKSTGIEDNSLVPQSPDSEAISQHVALVYLFTQKGTTKRWFGEAAYAKAMYGEESFDKTSKYFTHHTSLRNAVVGAGGQCFYQRIVPDDAGVKANVAVYLDVLKTKIPNYKRNSTGLFKVNELGVKELDDTNPYVDGCYIKWYKKHEYDSLNANLGELSPLTGTMMKWKMEEEEIHLLSSETNIDTVSTGLTQYADKTVYTYATAEDMWNPKVGDRATTRKKYTVGASGDRSGATEETFGTTPDVTVSSNLYPIFETRAAEQGEWYNLVGFSIESLFGNKVSSKILKETKTIPYSFYLYNRPDAKGTPKVVQSLYGETSTLFSFKKNAINPMTESMFSFDYITKNSYYNETNVKLPLRYQDLEGIYFYIDNYEKVLKDVVGFEQPFLSYQDQTWEDAEESATMSWVDFSANDAKTLQEEFGFMNPFTCMSTKKVPYFGLAYNPDKPHKPLDGFTEVNMTNNAYIFLDGGSDGTLSNENYEKKILEDLERYLDPNDIYQELAVSVESFLYDTGFELETKKKMSNFIGLRKDTILLLGTHYYSLGNKCLGISDQRALGSTLNSAVKLLPESEYFGTPTTRCAIIMGTGTKDGSDQEYSLVEQVAIFITKLMGGGNKKWNSVYLFDKAPYNKINDFSNIKPAEIGKETRETLWQTGLNYPQNYERKTHYFAGLQTVYEDETSVLNSLINVLAVPYCERVANEVHREFTGTMSMSDGEFIAAIKQAATKKLNGKFDGVITTVVEAVLDERDLERGFSWHLNIKLYMNVSKTVQIYTTSVYRTSALETK